MHARQHIPPGSGLRMLSKGNRAATDDARRSQMASETPSECERGGPQCAHSSTMVRRRRLNIDPSLRGRRTPRAPCSRRATQAIPRSLSPPDPRRQSLHNLAQVRVLTSPRYDYRRPRVWARISGRICREGTDRRRGSVTYMLGWRKGRQRKQPRQTVHDQHLP